MDASKEKLKTHIRWMIRRDMAEVLEIERLSFEFPWFEEDFIRCLRQRNCIGLVAEAGMSERVVGFIIYGLWKKKIHILNIAVHTDYRRRSVASQIMEKMLGKLSSQLRVSLTAEVRESNLPAQLFLKSHGFRAVTVLRNYYQDSEEDAYLFRHRFQEALA